MCKVINFKEARQNIILRDFRFDMLINGRVYLTMDKGFIVLQYNDEYSALEGITHYSFKEPGIETIL